MKKTEMIDQENGKKSWKLIFALALLGIALALLTIIGLIKFGTVLFFVPFWFWTVDKIIELTGANLWLARGFAALFVLPFFYLVKLIFSWKSERRMVGWILFSVLTASLCFTMFFLSEDIYFSFKTGQAKKWYIVTPAGEYKFSASPGYNTFWGIEYQQITPEVIRKYVEWERAGKATKTTGDKEIVPAIPKENIPGRTVEKVIPEKRIVPQEVTPKEIIPQKTAKEIIPEKKKVVKKPASDGGKEITPERTAPKELASPKTTEETISKEVVPEKVISKEIVPKETISKEIASTKTAAETESFSLSPEEEKLIVKEIKKLIPPASYEEEKLSDFIKLLERSGNLPKHEDLLRTLVEKELNRWPHLSDSTREVISYLAKIGSAKSIPTLMWAYVKVEYSSDREVIEEAIKTIKKREGID